MKLSLLLLFSMVLSAQAPVVLTGNSVIRNAVIAATAPVGNDPVFNSLTHYWSMDEASGTRVDSKGVVNLTESGGSVSSGTGIDGNAASWPGSGTAKLIESTFGFSTVTSVSFWFKANAAPPDYSPLLIGPDDTDPSLEVGANEIPVAFTVATQGDGSLDHIIGSTGNWHLFVIVFTSSVQWDWSIDGAAFRSVVIPNGAPTGTSITVGGPAFGSCINGLIDEVGIYSAALTQGNVTTLYAGGSGIFYRP